MVTSGLGGGSLTWVQILLAVLSGSGLVGTVVTGFLGLFASRATAEANRQKDQALKDTSDRDAELAELKETREYVRALQSSDLARIVAERDALIVENRRLRDERL